MSDRQKLVAIRSLASVHHANKLVPSVISVEWIMAKRCNYDCSYCYEHTHDNWSPHIDVDVFARTVKIMHSLAAKQNKQIKWSLSGGEPMIHPHILELLELIGSSPISTGLSVVTNGACAFDVLNSAMQYIQNLTVSLHLERSQTEIDLIIEKTHKLQQNWPQRFIIVTVMCLPGHNEQITKIKKHLCQLELKHTFRLIKPNIDPLTHDLVPIGHKQNKKNRVITINKQAYKEKLYAVAKEKTLEYYTEEDLNFVQQNNTDTTFVNLGAWYQDGTYREMHSNQLLAMQSNQFKNWLCYRGIDGVYIDFDGHIYRGNCNAGGPIGKIGEEFVLPSDPITCPFQVCLTLPDITTRKCRSPEYLHLVND
jgi:MoaA/NifB/PqqE/SkfB family radical SAM enzyme